MSNSSFVPAGIAIRFHVLVASLCLGAACALPAQSAPPAAERHDVTEVFFGQTLTDPYRWLENWREGKGADWLKAQDTYTRSALNGIPGREKFLARVKALTPPARACATRRYGAEKFSI
jgi:prolyl oligopeptidase